MSEGMTLVVVLASREKKDEERKTMRKGRNKRGTAGKEQRDGRRCRVHAKLK